MKGLLIMDMQMGSFTPYNARYNTLEVIKVINLLSNYFREHNQHVIFIQHDGSKEQNFIPDSESWKLLPELIRYPQDIFISKTSNDAFYNSNLEKTLTDLNISELFITGCASDFCVDITLKSAHYKDYKLTIIKDGHTTAPRPFLDAQTIIQHYNWLWEDMIPTKYSVSVKCSEEVLNESL